MQIFQAEELPQGIEGIKGLAEIWALQVHLKHPNVNTTATESGIFSADCEWHNAKIPPENLHLHS